MRYSIILLIFLSCFMCFISSVYGRDDASSQKIVISNFDVKSAGKYAHLRDGLQSMLASRLSAKEGVELLDYRISERELADLKDGAQESGPVFAGVEPDYLVTGALLALTNGLNIRVSFYPLSGGGEVLHFSATAESDELIISKVDQLSQDIAVKVFSRGEVAPDTASLENESGGVSGFVTVHPEVAYKKGLYSGSVLGVGDHSIKVSTEGVRRTGEVASSMIAMAVGDLDGDAIKEIVLLSDRELRILQFIGREMLEIGKTNLPPSTRVHAVNVADLDNDGKMEIYLSATENLSVSSLIMQWNKTDGFSTIKRNIPWYIRPVNHPERGLIIAGQQRGLDRIDLVKKGVYQLELKADNSFAKGSEILLPRFVNLFDFAYADIDGDKRMETAVIDQNEKLRIYDRENGLLWVSSEDYGGSNTYIGPSQGGSTERNASSRSLSVDENSDRDLVFVPGRIAVVDLDKNGRQDIVVINNIASSMSFFNKLRIYDGGSIVGLTWNGDALVETWRTGRQSGYIADFDFSMQTDSASESKEKKGVASLYIGQVPNSGTLESLLPGSGRSKVTVYELGFSYKN